MPVLQKQSLIDTTLNDFVGELQTLMGANLISVVVFGSAATGQWRSTSDVNVMVVVNQFNAEALHAIREPLRLAQALVQLHVMFIQEDELQPAANAFTLKFSDILARHKILHGANVLASIHISREDIIATLQQSLLNFQLRGREHYLVKSLREEQLTQLISDAAAPLRNGAAALRQLHGLPPLEGKPALEAFVDNLKRPDLQEALHALSVTREGQHLAPGQGPLIYLRLLEIGQLLQTNSCQLLAH